jgi:general secretion pathway protein G
MKHSKGCRVKRQGFTLMEMLIVLIILVILVGMVAPRLIGSRDKAEKNSAKAQIGLFKSALESYEFDCRSFPSTEQGLQALIQAPASDSETGTATTGWGGPYLNSRELPKDPWGGVFNYEYPPTRGSGPGPDIWSFGPDGQDGTEDDIVSWTSPSTGEEGDLMEERPDEPPMDNRREGPPPMEPAPPLPGPPDLPPPPPPANR